MTKALAFWHCSLFSRDVYLFTTLQVEVGSEVQEATICKPEESP